MLFNPKHEQRLGRLQERLRRADAVTPDLMSDVIAQACTRFAAYGPNSKAKVQRLIESGAWIDATLAMIELELPHWKLQRLVCDGGEWLCSLSRQPWLPLSFDEVAEASHEILPLAILSAFVEARRSVTRSSQVGSHTVPQVRPAAGLVVCCDNFS